MNMMHHNVFKEGNVKTKITILASIVSLLAMAGYLWLAGHSPTKPVVSLEKITIGTNLNEMLGLLFIAEDRGYYQAQGLEVFIKEYQSGLGPLKDLREGRLDLASCAEFAMVGEVFAGGVDLRGLAVIGSGEVDWLIARRDRGINQPDDLRGKTIGVPRKTSAEFFLGRFLTLNKIPLKEVTLVDVKPLDLADAMAAGKVDAVLIWAPIAQEIIRKVGPDTINWPAQGGQSVYRLLVTREEYIKKYPVLLVRLMRSLAQAAQFAREQPEEAREIIARRLQVPRADLQTDGSPITYELFLDQALLLAMEDQARWMIRNRLTGQTQVPNYLDYLDAGPLLKVKPKAVNLVLPGLVSPK